MSNHYAFYRTLTSFLGFSVISVPVWVKASQSRSQVTFFLDENFEIRKLTRRILKPNGASDSPVYFMCYHIGFFKNLLSSDFGGHFFIFGLYFKILSPDEIDVLPMVEPRIFAVSADFGLKPSSYY